MKRFLVEFHFCRKLGKNANGIITHKMKGSKIIDAENQDEAIQKCFKSLKKTFKNSFYYFELNYIQDTSKL
jgi:hypothetical protein